MGIGSDVAKTAHRHVLFVTEKWAACNPARGVSDSACMLLDSLATTGLATQVRYHFDEYYLAHHEPGDAELYALCARERPDLVFLSLVADHPGIPKRETLRRIREELRIPVVAILWDSWLNLNMQLAEKYLPEVDLHIVVDSRTAYLRATLVPEKYRVLWVPYDSRSYYVGTTPPDIPLSFLGQVKYKSNRADYLEALSRANIPVFLAGGDQAGRMSVSDYVNLYRRSRMTLNFCLSNDGRYYQVKGRVFEVLLCGTFLLEEDGPETPAFFTPMVDYVPFFSKNDLVDKVRYFSQHDDERAKIARQGHATAESRYSDRMFWKTLFQQVDPIVPSTPSRYTVGSGDAPAPDTPQAGSRLQITVNTGNLHDAAPPLLLSIRQQLPLFRGELRRRFGFLLPATDVVLVSEGHDASLRVQWADKEIGRVAIPQVAGELDGSHLVALLRQHLVRLAPFFVDRTLAEQIFPTVELPEGARRPTREIVCGVIGNLLAEKISIQDRATIQSTLRDYLTLTTRVEVLTEYVRQALSASKLTPPFLDIRDGHLILLSKTWEHQLTPPEAPDDPSAFPLSPEVRARFIADLRAHLSDPHILGRPAVLVVPPGLRPRVRRIIHEVYPDLTVLSTTEVLQQNQRGAIWEGRCTSHGEVGGVPLIGRVPVQRPPGT